MDTQIKLHKGHAGGSFVDFTYEFPRVKERYHFSLEESIFSIFSDCFNTASKSFNYYGPTEYNQKELKILEGCLQIFLNELDHVDSLDGFITFCGSKPMNPNLIIFLDCYHKEWRSNWKLPVQELRGVCVKLIEIARICIKNNAILGVYGV